MRKAKDRIKIKTLKDRDYKKQEYEGLMSYFSNEDIVLRPKLDLLSTLPLELQETMAAYLPIEDILQLCKTNTSLAHSICNNKYFWNMQKDALLSYFSDEETGLRPKLDLLSALPPEIRETVVEFLPIRDILQLCKTKPALVQNICNDEDFWRMLIEVREDFSWIRDYWLPKGTENLTDAELKDELKERIGYNFPWEPNPYELQSFKDIAATYLKYEDKVKRYEDKNEKLLRKFPWLIEQFNRTMSKRSFVSPMEVYRDLTNIVGDSDSDDEDYFRTYKE